MHCFPHTGYPSTNRILPTGHDLLHIPQEMQPSSTWKLLVPMTKRTNKGFTIYVFSQAALPSCTFQTHIVPACTHGITIAAVRQPELRQKINQDTGCIPGVYRKNDTQSIDFHQFCGYQTLLQAINNADSSITRSLCKQFCNPARVSGCGKLKYHRQYVLPTKVMI